MSQKTDREEELEEALEYAAKIIESYQMDIRKLTHDHLILRGFCEGQIYNEAIPKIMKVLGKRRRYVTVSGNIQELGKWE